MLYKQQQPTKLPKLGKLKGTLVTMHANTVSLRNLVRITLTDETSTIRPDLRRELNNSITFLDDLGTLLNRMHKSI